MCIRDSLCAVLPQRWVALYSAPSELATMLLPPPLEGIEYAVDMIWHASEERNAAHRWLRRVIVEEFDVLYAPPALQKRRVGHPPSRLDEVPPLAAAL